MLKSIALLAITLTAPMAQARSEAPTVVSSETSAQRMMACTREYRPVCARTRSGRLRTFPNACEARRAEARIVSRRPCRGR